MTQPSMDRFESLPDVNEEMIAMAVSGDKDSMTAIYDAYAPRLYRYFYSRVMNAMDAEDLLAQTFLKVLESLPRDYEHQTLSSESMVYLASIHRMLRLLTSDT